MHLEEIKQLRLSGWKGFKLYLQDSKGSRSELPVIKGIYSVGGKDGVKAWMDLEYREELKFSKERKPSPSFSLSSSHIDQELFSHLGKVIPSGGHLMISYEGEQKIHTSTLKSLSSGIPAVLTPLGTLIFRAGFHYIKDWYLAEGGHEGPRKIWGEKAPDARWEKIFLERTAQQIRPFLDKKSSSSLKELEKLARKRAQEILKVVSRI
ncbi:MAG: DUF1122 domain-containing protein [Candidatus Aminicenantes bacterium]|nr:DUF1122 domain-containing protein [Candidatus Aminicenantes bacterium]